MNFIRKRPPVTFIDELSSIYNLLANKTIQNLNLEQKGDYLAAIRGWKSTHTQVLFRLDLLSKNYPNHENTADEFSVKDGIDELLQKAIVHLTRVECLYNDMHPDQSQKSSITSSLNSIVNPPSVPSLRSKSPQSFTVRHQQQVQSQPQQSRLLKTLRPSHSKTTSSSSIIMNNKSSAASWIAANTATNSSTIHTSTPKPNWTTSKSLPPKRSHSPMNTNFEDFNTTPDDLNIFDDSFKEDDLIDFNEKMQKRNESLSRLEASGKESQIARLKAAGSVLPSQFEKMSLSSSPSPPSHNDLTPPNEIRQIRSSTPPLRPPIPSTKSLIDIDQPPKAPVRRIQSPNAPPLSSTKPSVNKPPVRPASKPHVTLNRPVIKSYVKQQPVKAAAKIPVSKAALRAQVGNNVAKATTTVKKVAVNPKPKPTTASNTLKPPAPSASTSKPRSQSPREPAPTGSKSNTGSPEFPSASSTGPEFVDETQLSEKEIKDKMEDQIISEIQGIDYQSAKQIFNEIVITGDEVHWDDIAGLETAKNSLKETVVYPFLRPDLFSGLREPARGMLLFGPPGTGKTMLARAVATESRSTFFSISASSLTSKYLGESEKLVRALFLLARKLSPAIVFVDEIDSILSSRSENGENESSRRIKNEFLIQWSNLTHAAAGNDHGEDLQRVLVLAATNLPWQIDEAARRRFVRRQYIPLPEFETRLSHLRKLLKHQTHNISEEEVLKLAEMTDGYSGSDITALAKDAAMGPLRSLGEKLLFTEKADIRGIELQDFVNSLKYIKPSVSTENLKEFDEWAEKFGSSGV